MKKFLCLISVCFLGACAQIDMDELTTCITEQATKMVRSGAASASPMRTSVKKILNACGVEDQTSELKQIAQSILTEKMK